MLMTSSLTPSDVWDPNNWTDSYEYRIYEGPGARTREPYSDSCFPSYAIVDAVDYPSLSQYRWSRLYSQNKKRFYLRRTVAEIIGNEWKCEETGKRMQQRRTVTLFLHQAIMDRMGIPKPSPKHLVGHLDDKQLNCRRENLVWLLPGENQKQAYASGEKIPPATLGYWKRMARDLK